MSDTPKENVWARDLAWRLFRDAADEDYLIARWSMKANLPYQFAWSAQQCLEKYLKCSLVLNGQDTRNYHHKLKEMWHLISRIADDLLPIILCPPRYFPDAFTPHGGRFELASTFVQRVESLGDPNQRYRYYSVVNEAGDIHKLDQIVFALRRVTYLHNTRPRHRCSFLLVLRQRGLDPTALFRPS